MARGDGDFQAVSRLVGDVPAGVLQQRGRLLVVGGAYEGQCRSAHAGHRAGVEQAAAGQYAHPVADLLHLVEQVAGEDDGALAIVGQAANQFAHLNDAGRVKPVGGLVQDEQGRVAQEGCRDPQALFHSGGTGAKLAAGRVAVQTHGGQQIIHFGAAAVRSINTLQAFQIVLAGKVRPENGPLDQGAQFGEGDALPTGPAFAQQGYGAGGGADETRDHRKQGGLAGTVGAQEAEHAAGRDHQADVVNRGDAAEPLGQPRSDDSVFAVC